MPVRPQRRADREHRDQFGAGQDQPADFAFDRVEQRVLKQQIVDRVSRQAQLGEHHQPDPRLVAAGEQCLNRAGVMPGLGDRGLRHAGADADELVPVGRKERGHF